MILTKSRFFFTLALVTLLSACVSLPKIESPKFEYQRHYIADVDKKKITIMVELEAYNPNDFGVEDVNFLYQVKLKNRKLASGVQQDIDLEAKQTSTVEVPIVLYYKDIQRNMENVLKNIIFDTRKIEATISMHVANASITTDSGWKVSVPLRYKKTVKQDIPLPTRDEAAKKLKDEADRLKKKLKSLF